MPAESRRWLMPGWFAVWFAAYPNMWVGNRKDLLRFIPNVPQAVGYSVFRMY